MEQDTTAYLLNGRGCGKVEQKAIPYQPRIVGGINAKRERHPWLVNLQAYFVANKTRSTAIPCSGTLITRRFVLTAARCVLRSLDQGKGVLASIVEVYYSDAERRKGNFRRARDIIIHPGFNPLTRLHNVALLRLFKTINRTKLARPNMPHGKTRESCVQKRKCAGMGMDNAEYCTTLRHCEDRAILEVQTKTECYQKTQGSYQKDIDVHCGCQERTMQG
nr:granzyme H-like [Rhipicephalus microplus]